MLGNNMNCKPPPPPSNNSQLFVCLTSGYTRIISFGLWLRTFQRLQQILSTSDNTLYNAFNSQNVHINKDYAKIFALMYFKETEVIGRKKSLDYYERNTTRPIADDKKG